MSAPVTNCPRCTTELRHSGDQSYCPRCLVQAALSLPSALPPLQQAQAPQPEDLAPLFPDFEIYQLLGAGGMGLVYEASQKKLDRLVALKLLPADDAAVNAEFAERFEREARSLALLNHSEVVQVYDQGRVEGWFYIVMELVKGPDLARVLRREGAFAPTRAIALFTRLCETLAEAHRLGIVHRDLKPANLLLECDSAGTETLKIADFGLAKLLDRPDENFTLTTDQAALGTPLYMSPEQRAGTAGVDHRADIYSLGVVFYEMLTGEIPTGNFKAPSQLVAISTSYDKVILKALEPDPADRFADLSEVVAALERARRRPFRLVMILPVLVLVLAGATVAVVTSNREEPERDAESNPLKANDVQPPAVATFDWSRAITMESPKPGEQGYFGSFSDRVGDLLVLSAPAAGQFGPEVSLPGKVHLYRFDDRSPPELTATLQAPDPKPEDHFGAVVDLSPDGRDLVVFGRQPDQPEDPWVAYCYQRGGNEPAGWRLAQTISFEPKFATAGSPVRGVISGSWLAVSSPSAPASQALRLYRRSSEGWTLHSVVGPGEDLQGEAQFGFQARFHGDQLFVSAPRSGTGLKHFSGALYIFELEDDRWIRRQKITQPKPNIFAFFGMDWSYPSPDRLLVGCMGDTAGAGLGTGSVLRFARNPESGLWDPAGRFTFPDPKVGRAGFGQQLVSNGDGLLAVHASEGSREEGLRSLTHIFSLPSDFEATPQRLVRVGAQAREIWLGRALFTENHLIIGAPNASHLELEAVGRVYLCPTSVLRKQDPPAPRVIDPGTAKVLIRR